MTTTPPAAAASAAPPAPAASAAPPPLSAAPAGGGDVLERAIAWAEALCSEPRPTEVAAYGDDGLLLRVDVPTRHGAEQPHLLHYRRTHDGGWEAGWTMPWATQAVAVDGGYVCVRREQGRTLIVRRPAGGGTEHVLFSTPGRAGTLAVRPGGTAIAVSTTTYGGPGEHPQDLLAGSDAVWAQGCDMTLSHAKQPQGPWQIHLIPLDATPATPATPGTPPRDLTPHMPAGVVLTGESAWSGPATLLLGAQRHHRDGIRRFGLLALTLTPHGRDGDGSGDTRSDTQGRGGVGEAGGGGGVSELFSDSVDLCYPVQGQDGQVAYLATTVRRDNEPVTQYACLLDRDLTQPRLLPARDGLWQRPVGWDGPHRLVCTAESGPRRALYVHDLDDGSRHTVPLPASVTSARIHAGRAAVLTSAPDTPPALDVTTLPTTTSTTPTATTPVAASAVTTPAAPAVTTPAASAVPASASAASASAAVAPFVERVVAAEAPLLPGRLTYRPQRIPTAQGELASWVCLPEQGPARGTVVLFHGGPFKSWSDWSWRWNPWPFVACGLAVVLVEPPMSLGYPDAVRTGWRQWRGGSAACAAAQVEAVRAAEGLLDSPLALMGGSFGGYLALTTAETLNPDLVVAHAAPLDLAQVAESSDVGWQWIREFGDPTHWRPLYQLNSLFPRPVAAGTRVLLSHGLQDGLVPPTETLRTHRALARQGVRSEVAFFRSEAHPLSRPGNIRAWYRWVLSATTEELTPPDQLTQPTREHLPSAGEHLPSAGEHLPSAGGQTPSAGEQPSRVRGLGPLDRERALPADESVPALARRRWLAAPAVVEVPAGDRLAWSAGQGAGPAGESRPVGRGPVPAAREDDRPARELAPPVAESVPDTGAVPALAGSPVSGADGLTATDSFPTGTAAGAGAGAAGRPGVPGGRGGRGGHGGDLSGQGAS